MADESSSDTEFGVPPNEKDGLGAAGRAGGSGTVTEARAFAWESRHAAVVKTSPTKRIRPSRPASPMHDGYQHATNGRLHPQWTRRGFRPAAPQPRPSELPSRR